MKMLPEIVASFGGGRGILICDPFVHQHILPTLDALNDATKFVTEIFGGECTEGEIKRLVAAGGDCGCVIGLGGGKTLDTAKAVSAHLKVGDCVFNLSLDPVGDDLFYDFFPCVSHPNALFVCCL
jgi:glycerol dehydrogenase